MVREVGKVPIASFVVRPDGEHFTKLVIRNAQRSALPEVRAVFDARHPEVEITSFGGLRNRRPRHLHEPRLGAEPFGNHGGDIDVESAYFRRITRIRLDEW